MESQVGKQADFFVLAGEGSLTRLSVPRSQQGCPNLLNTGCTELKSIVERMAQGFRCMSPMETAVHPVLTKG
jgi:hypothetical protein